MIDIKDKDIFPDSDFLGEEEQGYREAVEEAGVKIVVLDDDPTGIQTVHGVYVYTHWDKESIRQGFAGDERVFYILTNSRSMGQERSVTIQREIAANVMEVSEETGRDFLLVSRGDSTLRGHYPAETDALREGLEQKGLRVDGEILCPFFEEGGRFTIRDIHYVKNREGKLIPAGDTEFARDATFGYRSSDLKEWVEEKSCGRVRKESVLSISLNELREGKVDEITEKLMGVQDFGRVVVNAACYGDLKVFAVAFWAAWKREKRFLLRTAASAVQILGGITEKPMLTSRELHVEKKGYGGLIVIGSHVDMTTRQLNELKKCKELSFLEFHAETAAHEVMLISECQRISEECSRILASGKSVVVYTSRRVIHALSGDREENLRLSVRIADAVTEIVASLSVRPKYLVAKGGITSSNIGTKALNVRKAFVPGQILPGIPVWVTGEESRFPGLPYVIFPGNVGEDGDLLRVVKILEYGQK